MFCCLRNNCGGYVRRLDGGYLLSLRTTIVTFFFSRGGGDGGGGGALHAAVVGQTHKLS